MPLAAQRQRASLLPPAGAQNQQLQRPASSAFKGKAKANDDDETTTSESDSSDDEVEAALEMDGQELWTQNYCAVCDCLIEPGTGVGLRKWGVDAESSSKPSGSLSPSVKTAKLDPVASGLQSRSGTVKARPPSSEGPGAQSKADSTTSAAPADPIKRTHSAGRLHAVGGTGGLHKRTGSTGSRLNALSELKPTTRLNGDKTKAAAGAHGRTSKPMSREASGEGKRSPAISRRDSAVSSRSAHSHGTASNPPSGPPSPAVQTTALPRTKKGGLLGPLTPSLLKQEEEAAQSRDKAAPALYCSERCRAIDERRSPAPLVGEFGLYMSGNPALSPTAPTWSSAAGWQLTGPMPGPTGFPRRIPSMTSMPAGALNYAAVGGPIRTPESECLCAECLERSSASGTVPSGASDTTDSSVSAGMYGRQKQRTLSGRAITPLNPHYHDGYFPAMGVATGVPPARTGSASRSSLPQSGAVGGRSVTATDASSDSDQGGQMWEPNLRPPRHAHDDDLTDVERRSRRSSYQGQDLRHDNVRSSLQNEGRTRSSTVSEDTFGSKTAGTVTPAGSGTGSLWGRGSAGSSDAQAQPASSIGTERRRSTSSRPQSMSLTVSSSPLRLLRRGEHHASMPYVNVSSQTGEAFAQSFGSQAAAPSTVVSRSLASAGDGAEFGGSGITLAAPARSGITLMERRGQRTVPSLVLEDAGATVDGRSTASKGVSPGVEAAPMSRSHSHSASVGDLGAISALSSLQGASRSRRGSENQGGGSSDLASRRASASSFGSATGGWLRSLTSAWSTIRGQPVAPTSSHGGDSERRDSMYSESSAASSAGLRALNAPSSGNSRRQSMVAASPAVGSLTALSTLDAQSRGEHPTPTQSLVAKPTFERGSVPRYAAEVGHGQIPGDTNRVSRSYAGEEEPALTVDEERRRRKAERERALRHQRSKEVTMLPPLLVTGRAASSTNLYAMRPRSTRTQSNASSGGSTHRARAGSASHAVGSAGSYKAGHQLVGPSTPSLRRSPHSQSRTPAGDFVSTFTGPPSAGTSPRRAGLGWGNMTVLASSNSSELVSASGNPAHMSGYSSSIGSGHAARGQLPPHHNAHRHHHHAPHHASRGHRHAHSHGHGHVGYPQRFSQGPQLGHIGLLGAHPHGHAPVYGRHATTPARSATPRVPEDGGEMSSAALTGQVLLGEESGMATAGGHPRRHLPPPPVRPRSVLAMRAQGWPHPIVSSPVTSAIPAIVPSPETAHHGHIHHPASHQHGRTWSYEGLNGLQKTYPVLQLPGRETHDQYDAGWGLGEGGLEEMLTGRKTPANTDSGNSKLGGLTSTSTSTTGRNAADGLAGEAPRRKKLFYFDH